MIVMSVDPGKSTGVCFVETTHEFEEVKVVYMATVKFPQVLFMISMDPPDLLIFETCPQYGSNDQALRVEELRQIALLHKVESLEVTPGNWKPFARANSWTNSVANSDHERDAYDILRWTILSKFGKDIGVV